MRNGSLKLRRPFWYSVALLEVLSCQRKIFPVTAWVAYTGAFKANGENSVKLAVLDHVLGTEVSVLDTEIADLVC